MPFRRAGQQRMDGLPRRSLGLAPAHNSLAQCNKPGAAASATYRGDRRRPGASNTEVESMLLYEMVIASGIAVVLVVATIGGLAARIMMGSEELALLRQARAMRVDMGDLKRRTWS